MTNHEIGEPDSASIDEMPRRVAERSFIRKGNIERSLSDSLLTEEEFENLRQVLSDVIDDCRDCLDCINDYIGGNHT